VEMEVALIPHDALLSHRGSKSTRLVQGCTVRSSRLLTEIRYDGAKGMAKSSSLKRKKCFQAVTDNIF
jgi:hypothetical protein